MRGKYLLLLAVVLSACLVTPAYSVTWSKIGSSGLATTPAAMQDRWRPVFNSMATDGSGNVFATANNGNNRGIPGGLTIFKAGGGTVDINLNALGLQGGVTQLVTGGDGKVYGIQNWKQAWQWVYSSGEFASQQYGTEGLPERILRFNLDGSVDVIFSAAPSGGMWQAYPAGNTLRDTLSAVYDWDGAGNYGVGLSDMSAHATTGYTGFWRYVADPEQTVGVRFRLDSMTLGDTEIASLLQLSADTRPSVNPYPNINPRTSPTPAIVVRKVLDGGVLVPHFILQEWNPTSPSTGTTLMDLGSAAVTNTLQSVTDEQVVLNLVANSKLWRPKVNNDATLVVKSWDGLTTYLATDYTLTLPNLLKRSAASTIPSGSAVKVSYTYYTGNDWHEALLYVNALTGQVRLKWDGTPDVYNATWTLNMNAGAGYAETGASTGQFKGGSNTTITYDWIGYDKAYAASKADLRNVNECEYAPWDAQYGGNMAILNCPVYTGWGDHENYMHQLTGMAAGSDGNVYFTGGPAHRLSFLWRYNTATSTVEKAPSGLYIPADPLLLACGAAGGDITPNPLIGKYLQNDGWASADGMFLLVNCGMSPRDGKDVFAVTRTGAADAWGADVIQWDFQRDWGMINSGTVVSPTWVTGNGMGWGWSRVLHVGQAWDPLRNKLWMLPWSMNASAYWGRSVPNNTDTWLPVDFPGEPGNKAMQLTKLPVAPATTSGITYNMNFNDAASGKPKSMTIGGRFVVTEFTGAYNVWLMMNTTFTPAGWFAGRPVVGVVNIGGVDKWVWGVQQTQNTSGPDKFYQLGVLGDFALGVPHTCYLYAETTIASTSRKVKCWWDGTLYEKTLGDADPETSANASTGAANTNQSFGAGCLTTIGGIPLAASGTMTVVFDYVNVGRGELPPGTADTSYDFCFTGEYKPTLVVMRTNVMNVYSNTAGLPCLWEIDPAIPYTGGVTVNNKVWGPHSAWHLNGAAPDQYNHLRDWGKDWWRGGSYWSGEPSLDLDTGSCWVGFVGDAYYKKDLGHVMARNLDNTITDQGLVESGAAICAVKRDGATAYALACNMTTGVYSLYTATVPLQGGPQSVGSMKSRTAGTYIGTDVPKVVTHADTIGSDTFFYIEDADGGGGIRVLQPSTVPVMGDKVTVSGLLYAVNGEASITVPAVTVVTPAPNPDVKPLGMTVRSAGGKKLGPQPATSPAYGLNNVGLVVRIAGKVAAIPTDDLWATYVSSRNWFTIDDGTGATTRYMDIAATPVQQTIPGIKVLFDPGMAGVVVGDMVEVTGVVGVDFTYTFTGVSPSVTFNASGQRIIFCRTAADIYKFPLP